MNKIKLKVIVISSGLSCYMPIIWANDGKNQALLALLNAPQPEYKVADKVEFDATLYPKKYQIGWLKYPIIDVDRQAYQGYKRPITVAMTVIAAQGQIADVQVLKSTGSTLLDQRIIQALKQARLEPIRYADANLTYVLEHQFEIEKPL